MYTMHIEWRGDEDKRVDDEHSVAAQIRIDDAYLTLEIVIYKCLSDKWHNGKYDEVLESLIHEFCHVLTEPLYRFALEHCPKETESHLLMVRERQTEIIKSVITGWDKGGRLARVHEMATR
jgi:hypothetical protein